MLGLVEGYWTIGRWRGAPVRVHWATPIGMLIFTGGVHPARWLGYLVVVLVHEMGHAVAVRRARAHVESVNVHAVGGHCIWSGSVTPMWRVAIAFAGVWAQLALLAVALTIVFIWGASLSGFDAELFQALVVSNLLTVILNLVPIAPLDGAQAWMAFPVLWRRWQVGLHWRDLLGELRFRWARWRSPRPRVDWNPSRRAGSDEESAKVIKLRR